MAHARGKAREVATRTGIPEGGGVLAADTEVVLDGRALGKAADRDEAREMLRALSGRAHEVMTGVVLITGAGEAEALTRAEVRVRALDDAVLDWYLDAGEWQGRAGGYAVQGAGGALVASIAGEPGTVIGLPVATVSGMLRHAGIWPR